MIELTEVSKVYKTSAGPATALRPTSLSAVRGELVWVSGASGAGKSTLLGIAALLVVADTGEVRIDGTRVDGVSDAVRTGMRRDLLGFIPQLPRLFPELTAAQNVALAVRRSDPGAVAEALDRVGLTSHQDSDVKTLSGGEQQRVSVARALVSQPAAVLADEPSSGLDDRNAEAVFTILRGLADEDRCVIVASHDARIAPFADRRVAIGAPQGAEAR